MAQEFDAQEARRELDKLARTADEARAMLAKDVVAYLERERPQTDAQYKSLKADMRYWLERVRSRLDEVNDRLR